MDGLTERQLAAVRAYVATGSASPAAHELGIATCTLRAHLRAARRRAGVEFNLQLVAVLAASGVEVYPCHSALSLLSSGQVRE